MSAPIRRALLLATVLAACGDSDPAVNPDATVLDAGETDAPPAPCGIEMPGSRCAGPHTLEQCDGTAIETVDCGERFCGPDPAGADPDHPGTACIADGDPCGWIDQKGACDDDVLAYCSFDGLQVTDCADLWGICALVSTSIGYDCTTPCAEMSPPVRVEGTCVGNAIRRCVFENGEYEVRTDECPAGTSCEDYDQTGWPACMPDPPCTSIGPQGRCSGSTLTRCFGGSVVTTNCASAGGVCAYGGDETGYICAPSGAAGAFAVSGVVSYEDRAPGLGSLGARLPAPARGVAVAVVADDDGQVLGYALSSDDGSFLLHFDAGAGEMVHVLAATTSTTGLRPVRVLRPDGLVHGFGSASFAPAAATTRDVLVTDESGLAPAFNIFDQLVLGVDTVRDLMGVATPQQVWVQWIRGTTDGSYYAESSNGIFLLGEPSDDDGYDDAVILHELGHYVEDAYGQSDSPGGFHDGSPTDPRKAWSEGFATYVSSAVRGSRYYMDSNSGGGWWYDLEGTVTEADPGLPVTQDVSEDTVSEILWDVGDTPVGDDDPRTGAELHGDVLLVQPDWLRNDVGAGRGVMGVDLVDWIDGWFLLYGLSSCDPVRAIVELRELPYDFAGPAGSCP